MELRDYIRTVRKGWILIVAVVLAGGAAGVAFSLLATPKYDASTQLYVSVQPSDSATANDLVQGSSAAQRKVKSYVDVVTSSRVLQPVVDDLQLDFSAGQLRGMITAESQNNTVLLTITVRDVQAQRAAQIANAVGARFADVVNELERPEAGGPSSVKIATIEPAGTPQSQSSPRTTQNIVFGLLIGLLIGTGAVVFRSSIDTRIYSNLDIESLSKAPVLGNIGFNPDAKERPLVVSTDPMSPRAEAFRSLRTNLQFVNLGSSKRCFVITSSLPGEGKTTTTSNLGVALSETGASVVMVDGDLRLPRLAETMGLEGAVGLTDVLIGRTNIADVLQPWGGRSLFVLPAGRIPPNPSELLGSRAMTGVIEALTESFDYVLIDAPPLLPVTDAAVISKQAGGTLLVAASGRTRKADFLEAARKLDSAGSALLGAILTMTPEKGPDAYGYGSYGAYGQDRGRVEVSNGVKQGEHHLNAAGNH